MYAGPQGEFVKGWLEQFSAKVLHEGWRHLSPDQSFTAASTEQARTGLSQRSMQ